MREEFKYLLFSKNKKPLYIDDFGHIVEGKENYLKPDGSLAALQYAPKEWKDLDIKYARNTKWWGVFRDMAASMEFPEDGFRILKDRRWSEGIEAECHLGILRLDKHRLPYNYLAWYFSELNFVKYVENSNTCSIEALEGGPAKYLKAYENTKYEISIADDPERMNLLMDGMELGNTAKFAITNGLGFGANVNLGNHLVDAGIVQKEVEDIGGVQSVSRTKVRNNNQALYDTRNYIFKATAPARLKLKWDFRLNVEFVPPPAINPGAFLYVIARIVKPDNPGAPSTPATSVTLLEKKGSLAVVGDHLVAGEAFVNVVPGDEIYLYTMLTVEGATGDAQTVFTYGGTEPHLEITYTYKHPESNVIGISPYRLFQKLWEKMCGGRFTVKSDFLLGLKDVMITSGMGVRGNADAVIKTSMAEFFQWAGFYEVGLGAEGDKLVLERMPYFFRSDILVDLGVVKSAKLENLEEVLFNTIKVGWDKQEYNGINGIHEFNQGQQWATPVTKFIRELDMVSNYRTDPYGIELLRINFGQRSSTDSRSDNDTIAINVDEGSNVFATQLSFNELFGLIVSPSEVFYKDQVIRIKGSQFNDGDYTVTDVNSLLFFKFVALDRTLIRESGVNVTIEVLRGKQLKLKRPAYSSVTGLPYPATAFNLEFSPKTRLLNNGPFLRSVLDLMDDKFITLASADRNKDLSRTLNGRTITEKEPIGIGTLGEKYFRPVKINVHTEVPINLVELMKINPYARIRFTWKEKVYFAYLMDGGIKSGTNESQDWQLLSAPENDFKNFNP